MTGIPRIDREDIMAEIRLQKVIGTRTQIERLQTLLRQDAALTAMAKELQQVKGNNKGLIIMNAALRSRPDLGDRAPRVIELCEENVRLKKQLGEDL